MQNSLAVPIPTTRHKHLLSRSPLQMLPSIRRKVSAFAKRLQGRMVSLEASRRINADTVRRKATGKEIACKNRRIWKVTSSKTMFRAVIDRTVARMSIEGANLTPVCIIGPTKTRTELGLRMMRTALEIVKKMLDHLPIKPGVPMNLLLPGSTPDSRLRTTTT